MKRIKTGTAVVTGGSSGIGECTAAALAAAGWRVFALSRRGIAPEGTTGMCADITDPDAVQGAFDTVCRECQAPDLLIACAGYGISGAAVYTPMAEAKRQLEVNLLGTMETVRQAALHMKPGGRIVIVSSVAAVVPIPFQAWYSASKAALNSLTFSLANELRPLGISVCAVMPGDVKTGFTAQRSKSSTGDEAYGGLISRSVGKMEKDEQNGMPPERIAAYLVRVAGRRPGRLLYTPGAGYRAAVLLTRLLPGRWMNFIIRRLYAK